MSAPVPVPDGFYGPGHFQIGSFHRGRVVYDTNGRRMKIESQGNGSTTVRVKGRPVTIRAGMTGSRSFTPSESITVAKTTAVRLTKKVDS